MKSLALCLCVLAANTLFAAPEVSAPEKNRQQQEKPGDISCSDAEKAKLLQGEIVIRKAANPDGQTSGRTYDALGLITGTVGQVSDVLVDYEKYPQFMPNMETTQIKSTDGNTSVVECKLGLPMGQVKRYRLSLTASREEAEAYIT